MLKYITAGESHGTQITAILSGFPAGVPVLATDINRDLARRQMGYGRGGRMKIEKDKVEICSGIRFGKSLGSPITMVIKNRDFANWEDVMSPTPGSVDSARNVTRPRPGHADLAGALKYAHSDARNILERASARETAARVAVGSVCQCLLQQFDIQVFAHVMRIGNVEGDFSRLSYREIRELAEKSDVRCADAEAEQEMRAKIDQAKAAGNTLGGVIEVIATGAPVGLGDVMNWEDKLDGLLAQALMSIQAVKGVGIGKGFGASRMLGSNLHDEILFSREQKDLPDGHGPSGGFYHSTNRAGGIEGGMSNGEPIIARVAFKPIPTMMTPKASVDLSTKEPFEASRERSDVCAVPAAAVVAEAAVRFVLARVFLDKFGGDSLLEIRRNYEGYVDYLEQY